MLLPWQRRLEVWGCLIASWDACILSDRRSWSMMSRICTAKYRAKQKLQMMILCFKSSSLTETTKTWSCAGKVRHSKSKGITTISFTMDKPATLLRCFRLTSPSAAWIPCKDSCPHFAQMAIRETLNRRSMIKIVAWWLKRPFVWVLHLGTKKVIQIFQNVQN